MSRGGGGYGVETEACSLVGNSGSDANAADHAGYAREVLSPKLPSANNNCDCR